MQAIRKVGSSIFGRGEQDNQTGNATRCTDDRRAQSQTILLDGTGEEEFRLSEDTLNKKKEGWKESKTGGDDQVREKPKSSESKKRVSSIRKNGRRRPSLLGRFDRKSSWLSEWGSLSSVGKNDTSTEVPPLRSQHVRLSRLQRRVFPDREEMPGRSEWRGSVLLGATRDSDKASCSLRERSGVSSGLKPVPQDWARRVLTGHANSSGGDLQLMDCKVVRIFISSSADDFNYERDAFAAFCVPYLREVCRAEGLELEVMDWQWGIGPETTESLASDGIVPYAEEWLKRALKSASATCMIGLVGDKYGERPLPHCVPRSVFEAVQFQLSIRAEDVGDLLSTWFEVDENRRPAQYVLKSYLDVLGDDAASARRWRHEIRPALSALLGQGFNLAASSENTASNCSARTGQVRKTSDNLLRFHAMHMLSPVDQHIRMALSGQETDRCRPILVLRDFFSGAATDHKFSNPAAMRCQRQQRQQQQQEDYATCNRLCEGDNLAGGSFSSFASFSTPSAAVSDSDALPETMRTQHHAPGHLFANPVYSDANESCEQELGVLYSKLTALKDTVQRAGRGPLLRFQVDWEGRFDPIRSRTHARYVQSVILELTKEIEQSVAEREGYRLSAAFEEAHAHLALAYQILGRGFTGREELCEQIVSALEGNKSTNHNHGNTVVIYGPRGSGKSSLLAKVTVQLAANGSRQNTNANKDELEGQNVVICRFLSMTPSSETVPRLLESLAAQIYAAYATSKDPIGDKESQPQDFDEETSLHGTFKDGAHTASHGGDFTKIVSAFWDSLTLASAVRPLQLVLDGVDQLADAKRPCALSWLPSAESLPPHVHILVSATTPQEQEEALHWDMDLEPPSQAKMNKTLSTLMKKGYSDQIKVGGLRGTEQVSQVIDGWLKKDGRALRRGQRLALLAIAQRTKEPTHMMLRVMYNESLLWRSTQPVPDKVLQLAHNNGSEKTATDPSRHARPRHYNCDVALEILFDRIETQHGRELVQAVLSLLLVSRDGLSLMELQDLLSIDEKLLSREWVFEKVEQLPTIPRFPIALIGALLQSLDSYWSPYVRDRFGRFVFFNSNIHDFSFDRYLCDETVHRSALELLADYFGETFKTGELVAAKLNLTLGHDRLVLSQREVFPVAQSSLGRQTRTLVVSGGAVALSNEHVNGTHRFALSSSCRQGLLQFPNSAQAIQVNQRRMRELPFALLRSRRLHECLAELTRPAFIKGMVEAGGIDELLRLLRIKVLPEAHFRTALARAIALSKPSIHVNVDQLEDQLWGRLDACFRDTYSQQANGNNETGAKLANELLQQLDVLRERKSGLRGRWSNVLEPVNCPLVCTFEDHSRQVTAICGLKLQTGTRIVASAGKGSILKLWNLEQGNLLANCTGHDGIGGISALCGVDLWDGSTLVAAATGSKILLWDAETATLNALCEGGHRSSITCLCTVERSSDDARLLISASYDASISAWEATTGTLCWTVQAQGPVTTLSAIPEVRGETRIAAAVILKSKECQLREDDPFSPSCSDEAMLAGEVAILSASNGTLRAIVQGHQGRINAICSFALAHQDYFQDLEPAKDAESLPEAPAPEEEEILHFVASAGEDGIVLLCDAVTGVVRFSLSGHNGPVKALCVANLSNRGIILCSGGNDSCIQMWDVKRGVPISSFAGHSAPVVSLCAVQVSEGRTYVASGSEDAAVCLWDVSRTELIWRGASHTSAVSGLAVVEKTDGNECLLSCSLDKTIKAWDAKSTMKSTVIEPPVSPRGDKVRARACNPLLSTLKRVAVVQSSQNASLKPSRVLPTVSSQDALATNAIGYSKASWVTVVAACPTQDERKRPHMIVTGSIDKVVRVFDAANGEKVFSMRGHDDVIHTIISAGDRIISAGADKRICVWSAKTGKLKAQCRAHESNVRVLCSFLDADGSSLASGAYGRKKRPLFASGSDDGTVKVWSESLGLLTACVGHGDSVRALCTVVRPSSQASESNTALIASGSADQTIKLWTFKGELVMEMFGHRGGVNTLKFARDAGVLASGSSDNTIRFWEVEYGQCLSTADAGSSDGLGVFKTRTFSPGHVGGKPGTPSVLRSFFCSASFTSKTFTFWDAKTAQVVSVQKYPSQTLSCVAWSENGVLIFGCQDGRLCVCDNNMEKISRQITQRGSYSKSHLEQRPRPLLLRRNTAEIAEIASDNRSEPSDEAEATRSLFKKGLSRGGTLLSLSKRTNAGLPAEIDSSNNNVAEEHDEYSEARSPPADLPAHQVILLKMDSLAFLK